MTTAPFAWSYDKTRVDFDGQTLTINDKRFPLDRIERLARNVSRSTAQGSWNRVECWVHLFGEGQEGTIKFRGSAATEEWGPWRPLWDQVEGFVHEQVMPRLLDRAISSVAAGDPVEIGSAGGKGRGRFTVTSEAIQSRSWLSKPIPWRSIVEMSPGGDEVVVESGGKRRKRTIALAPFEYDAWMIPHLWQHFRER